MNEPTQAMEVMPSNIVPIRDNAQEMMRRATDVAGVCRDIVLKTACNIQGKKYIKAEGWMSIATAHGCIAGSRNVQKVEGGWTAIGEIRRISDGALLSTAEGFVGTGEKRWSKADEYACRAMAQTRAISRACRAAFAHVVILMDAGLSTTPYEEVPEGGFKDSEPPQSHSEPSQPPKPRQEVPRAEKQASGGSLQRAECTLDSVRQWTSPKGVLYHFCKFVTDSGAELEAGTKDPKIAETLEATQGTPLEITYKPGYKAGTFEICTVAPADNLP